MRSLLLWELVFLRLQRVRRRFVTEGIDSALNYRSGRGRKQKRLDGEGEAHLLAIACNEAPPGRERWTFAIPPSMEAG